MDQLSVSVAVTRTRADYVGFSRLAFKRLGVFNYRLIASALAVLLVFTLYEESSENAWVRRYVLADYSGLYIATLVGLYYVMLNFFYRIFTRNVEFVSAGQYFLRSRRFRIDESGVYEETENGLSTSFTAWAGVGRIELTRDHLLFYVDRMQAYIIPRRCFAGREACATFHAQAVKLREQAHAPNVAPQAVTAQPA